MVRVAGAVPLISVALYTPLLVSRNALICGATGAAVPVTAFFRVIDAPRRSDSPVAASPDAVLAPMLIPTDWCHPPVSGTETPSGWAAAWSRPCRLRSPSSARYQKRYRAYRPLRLTYTRWNRHFSGWKRNHHRAGSAPGVILPPLRIKLSPCQSMRSSPYFVLTFAVTVWRAFSFPAMFSGSASEISSCLR